MAGAVAIVIALLLFPVVFLMSMTVVAAALGTSLHHGASPDPDAGPDL
jgi:hypothetical protein